jgi:hypothetical protein
MRSVQVKGRELIAHGDNVSRWESRGRSSHRGLSITTIDMYASARTVPFLLDADSKSPFRRKPSLPQSSGNSTACLDKMRLG